MLHSDKLRGMTRHESDSELSLASSSMEEWLDELHIIQENLGRLRQKFKRVRESHRIQREGLIHREKRLLEKKQRLEQLIQENKEKLRMGLMVLPNRGLQIQCMAGCVTQLLNLCDSDNKKIAELKAEWIRLKDIVKDDDEKIEEELQAMERERKSLTESLKQYEKFDEEMVVIKERQVTRLDIVKANEEQRLTEARNTTTHVLQTETHSERPVRNTSRRRSVWKRFTKLFKG